MSQTETKVCQNCRISFVIEREDFEFYEKMDVPPPTFCYLCRAQRRMAYRNERALYKRKSDLSGEIIFSTFPGDVPFPVYTTEEWFSDEWDPMGYGREYDFSRPFFEQFKELSDKVPKPSKSVSGFLINSDYSNNAANVKNCYLLFNSGYNEDCAYGTAVSHSSNCYDMTNIYRCEFSCQNFNSARSSKSFFSTHVADCNNVYFSKNLKGCNDCFGCMNLRNKSYHIFNKPYSKQEYEKEIRKFDTGSYRFLKEILEKTDKFFLDFPVKFAEQGTISVDVIGEYVYHAKNVKYTYQCIGGEDLRYCQYVNYPPVKDCYDHSVYGEGSELSYECAMTGEKTNNTKFCVQTWTDIRNTEYCEYVRSSSNCFGCVGLRNQQYCIFNKRYSKSEYNDLVPRIKKHMDEMPYIDRRGRTYRYGEFFPIEFSPYGYNETIANEHFPLSKEEILEQGYNWKDVEESQHKTTIAATDLPDHIKDISDDILNESIGCAHSTSSGQAAHSQCYHGCTKAFRLIPPELQFYKRFNLPLPRLCPSCRHRERLLKRNTMHLYPRVCQCAGNTSEHDAYKNATTHFHGASHCPHKFQTAYSPDRPEIIYCKECYQSEFV